MSEMACAFMKSAGRAILATLIRRDHPMTFTDIGALDRTIEAQREQLRNGMSELDFFRVIAPVGAAARCGHTRTSLSEPGQEHFRHKLNRLHQPRRAPRLFHS